MNYHVADFIIRVKNAYGAKRGEVVMPSSNMVKNVAALLVKEGYLADVKEEERDGHKMLVVALRYVNRRPALTDVSIHSKPSLRLYATVKHVPETLKKGARVAVLSTNQGIMTGRDAVKKGVGGEILFTLW